MYRFSHNLHRRWVISLSVVHLYENKQLKFITKNNKLREYVVGRICITVLCTAKRVLFFGKLRALIILLWKTRIDLFLSASSCASGCFTDKPKHTGIPKANIIPLFTHSDSTIIFKWYRPQQTTRWMKIHSERKRWLRIPHNRHNKRKLGNVYNGTLN